MLKVKLCEGGLGAPRAEDVHWLDWHQLQSLISSGALLSYRLAIASVFLFNDAQQDHLTNLNLIRFDCLNIYVVLGFFI